MNSIIQSSFFIILNDHIYNNISVSKFEISTAYSVFRDEVAACMDLAEDMRIAYRFIGDLKIELTTLQNGIIAPNCEAGEKCSLPS